MYLIERFASTAIALLETFKGDILFFDFPSPKQDIRGIFIIQPNQHDDLIIITFQS